VPSADVDHAGRYPARLRADRYGDHPCRLGDQQQRVRASRPARRAELAAHQQHQSRPDALAGENAEDVRHRIRPAASSGPSAQQAKTTGTRLKQLRPIADARQKMAGAQRLRPQWPGKAGGGDLADHGDVHAGRAQSRDAAADSCNPPAPVRRGGFPGDDHSRHCAASQRAGLRRHGWRGARDACFPLPSSCGGLRAGHGD
jgi:hypothetical protein